MKRAVIWAFVSVLAGCVGHVSDEGADLILEEFKGDGEILSHTATDSGTSFALKLSILRNGKEATADDLSFANKITVPLRWYCHARWGTPKTYDTNSENSNDFNDKSAEGKFTVTFAKGEGSVTTTVSGLPARPQAIDEFYYACEANVDVSDTAEIVPVADSKINKETIKHLANDMSNYYFWKEEDAELDESLSERLVFNIVKEEQSEYFLKLEFTALKAGVGIGVSSTADVTVSITKGGELVAAGDPLFDEKREIKISGHCGDDMEDFETVTVTKDAKKAEVNANLILATAPTWCSVYAHTVITLPYTYVDAFGKEQTEKLIRVEDLSVWLRLSEAYSYVSEFELDIGITKNEGGKPLGYSVVPKGSATPLSGKVDMRLHYCEAMVVYLANDKLSISYGNKVPQVASESNGHLFLYGGYAKGCSLFAISGSGKNQKKGIFKSLNVPSSPSSPLDFANKSAGTVEPLSGTFTGKVWLFAMDSREFAEGGEADLYGYLDASAGITGATPLVKSPKDGTPLGSVKAVMDDPNMFLTGIVEVDGELTLY